jgi:hypothetical protein
MNATFETTPPATQRPDVPQLRQTIGWLCQLIRYLIVGYLIWIIYLVLEPITVIGVETTAAQWTTYWGLPKETPIQPQTVYYNRAIALISTGALWFLVRAVWNLMTGYLAGDIFSAAAARRLKRVGTTGVIAALVDVAIRPFMLGVMSTDIYAKATFYDWVGPVDLMYLLIALFILSLGHIHGTAAAISEEYQQFV